MVAVCFLMNTRTGYVCVSLVCAGLLSACMTVEPVRLPSSISGDTVKETPGILWSHSSNVTPFHTRWNHAIVKSVDGHTIDWQHGSIELLPGRHLVQIEHRRDSWFCGYLGCMPLTLGTYEIELDADEGHSYVPFAVRNCERDWIWIENIGNAASDDLMSARNAGGYVQRWYPAESTSRVVVGKRPPSECPVTEGEVELRPD